MYIKPEKLPAHLSERGEIYKTVLYSNPDSVDVTEIAVLELAPGAMIPLHDHPSDSEMYYFPNIHIAEICMTGGKHELENTSNETLHVISIKKRPGIWKIP